MRKEDILQSEWLNYLRWWRDEHKDTSQPPTEDGFWSWYALEVMEDLIIGPTPEEDE